MKKTVLVCGLLAAIFTVSVASAYPTWDGGGTDDRWLTAENWVGDVLPADGERVEFHVPGLILVEAGDSVNPRKIIGPSASVTGTVTMTFTGGNLVNTSYWYMGTVDGGLGVLNVQGATADVYTRDLNVGFDGGTGVVNISAGVLEVYGDTIGLGLQISDGDPGSSGTVNLSGGIIRAGLLNIEAGGLMDITAGQMILNGDQTMLINGYDGTEITAYGGVGDLVVTTFEDEGNTFTLVTAVPEPATLCLLGLGAMALIRKR